MKNTSLPEPISFFSSLKDFFYSIRGCNFCFLFPLSRFIFSLTIKSLAISKMDYKCEYKGRGPTILFNNPAGLHAYQVLLFSKLVVTEWLYFLSTLYEQKCDT